MGESTTTQKVSTGLAQFRYELFAASTVHSNNFLPIISLVGVAQIAPKNHETKNKRKLSNSSLRQRKPCTATVTVTVARGTEERTRKSL